MTGDSLSAQLDAELADLDRRGLLREPPEHGTGVTVLCSNDYLGLSAEPLSPSDAPAGAGASRLVSGDHPALREAEAAIGRWLGTDATLLFSSGYAANVGTLSALAGETDLIVSDALNHASIIDGCRLSRARVRVVPHRDPQAMAQALDEPARRRLVVTESLFSMDGTSPDLARLRAVCDERGASLVVDEAHALGVLGPDGRGLCAAAGIVPEVRIGTLGKALGLSGAFVTGSRSLRAYLWNRARSFVFSTGTSPAIARAIPERVARAAEANEARARLSALGERLRARLRRAGWTVPESHGPIVPLIVGAETEATALRNRLLAEDLFVQAIRPPTVPAGTARLRITLHASLDEAVLDRLAGVLGTR